MTRTIVWMLGALFVGTAASTLAQDERPRDRRGRPGGGGPPATPMTAIRGGTVHTGTGEVIENGVVVLRGDKIVAVGDESTQVPPAGVEVIDATGKHVYPGLIDADSRLLLETRFHSVGQARPDGNVLDAVDPMQEHSRGAAVQHGVTTVHVVPRGRGMVDGTGAVLKLRSTHSTAELVLKSENSIGAQFGGDLASARIRAWKTLRDQLRGARQYIEAWEEYEEKLEEYVKELEKLRKEAGKDDPGAEPAEGAEGGRGRPGGPPSGEGPEQGPGEEEGEKEEEGEEEGDQAVGDFEQAFARWWEETAGTALPQQRGRRGPPQRGGPPPQQGGNGGKDEKKDGPKKPEPPKPNPMFDALRRALEGKAALFVSVDSAADLINLLDLQREFHFRCVVSGGRESGQATGDLENAQVPLVYEMPFGVGDDAVETLRSLADSDTTFALSWRDADGSESRFLALAAASAVAAGMEPERALAAITSDAAKILGVSDRVGSLASGKDADVVLSDGPPLSSVSRVERVWIDGQVVYQR